MLQTDFQLTWHFYLQTQQSLVELLVTEKEGIVQEIDGFFIFPNVSDMSMP